MGNIVRVVILGDLCLSGDVERNILNNPKYDPFTKIRPLLGEDDLLVANIECAVSSLGEPKVKYATLRADPRVIERLDRLDIAILGNNHIADFGNEAAEDTCRRLSNHGIATVGWGNSLPEALKPLIIERKGSKLRDRE